MQTLLARSCQSTNSNGIPAGIYKILRDSDEKNPNPWLLTPTATVQTSRQMTAPMIVTVRRAAPIGVLDTPAVIWPRATTAANDK